MPAEDEPIEVDLIRSIACVDVRVLKTEKTPTTTPDWHMEIEGRLGEEEDDDVEFAGMGFIYVIAACSFADARPRGASDMHYEPTDEWTVADTLRHFRFSRGELSFDADYVRGRCMKTAIRVRKDGSFILTTTNRGEAATRWVARLQGKKPVSAVQPL